jgi:hypothetical protein
MASLPTPIRATLGLLATALDAVQELVDHAPEIPMEAVGNSMQLSMRLQQHYVALLTRGDEFLASLRGAPDEPPAWATFDEPPPPGPDADRSAGPESTTSADTAAGPDSASGPDSATGPGSLFEDELSADDKLVVQAELSEDAVDELPEAEIQDGPRHAGQGDPLLAAATRGRPPGASAAKPATKAAKKAAAKKAAAGAPTPANEVARKVPAKKVPAKKTPAIKALGGNAAPVKAKRAEKAAARKGTPAKKTPPVKAVSAGRRATSASTPAAPPLASAESILTPAVSPARRRRPAKKAGPRQAAAPQLDASLNVGAASARLQSAFDRVDASTDADPGDVGLGAFATPEVADNVAAGNGLTANDVTGSDRTGNSRGDLGGSAGRSTSEAH